MGTVESIYVADAAGTPMRAVEAVRAVVGKGLEGDRYYRAIGSFSRWPDSGRAVTLIAAETLEAIVAEVGIELGQGRARRNLVTRGVDLPALNGRRFRIGEAVFRGSRVAAPCKYLERITEAGVFAALRGRGGLRADVIESGVIKVGDLIVPL